MKLVTVPKEFCVRTCAIAALAVLIATAAFGPLHAKSTTWTGASPLNDLWSNAANWSNGVPESNDDVYFGAIGGTSTLDLPPLMLNELDMTGYTGILDAHGANFMISGDMTTSGECAFDGATLLIAGDLEIIGTMSAPHATIAIGADLSISGELDCDHAAEIEVQMNLDGSPGAVLNMGSSRLTLYGNGAFSDFSSVSWNEGGALVLKGAAGTQQIAFGTGTVALHDVTVERSSRSDVTAIESPVPLVFGGNVSVQQGTLQLVSNDVEFGGTVTVRGELVYAVSGGALRFTAGLAGMVDVTAGGAFRISGVPPDRARIRQDGVPGGDRWILGYDGTSTIAVDGVEVQDSDAQGPAPAPATNSADKGNNANWNFIGPKTTKWIAESLTSDSWSDPLNWDVGSPETGDAVVFDTIGGTSSMDITGLALASLDMSGYRGELTLMHSLDLTGNMTSGGTVTLGGNSLAIAGSLTVWGWMNAPGAAIAIGADLNLHGRCRWTPGATVNVTGDVEALGGAIIEMGSSLLRIGGDLLLSTPSGLYLCDIGHLVCAGASPVQVVLFPPIPNSVMLGDVTVERAAAGDVTQMGRIGMTLVIEGDLDVTQGILELTEAPVVVGGATSIGTNGRLDVKSGGSHARFDGPVTVRGALSYRNESGSMRFAPGAAGAVDVTGGGVFEAIGTVANRITLDQDGVEGGDRWILLHDETSTIDVDYVELQDGDAQGPGLAAAMNSVDLGNNLNWYFGTVSETAAPPLRLALEAAPNPFNPSTTLRYDLPSPGEASIRIYDAAGRLVRSLVSGIQAAGHHQTTWDGRNDAGRRVGSGAYFCRLESNGEARIQKLLLMR